MKEILNYQHKPNIEMEDSFITLLLDDPYCLQLLLALPPPEEENRKEIAKQLVTLFLSHGRITDLLTYCISFEIGNTTKFIQLFRQDSFNIECVQYFLVVVAKDWLLQNLIPILKAVVQKNGLELAAGSCTVLDFTITSILESLLNTVDKLIPEVKQVARMLKKAANAKFINSNNKNQILSSFFFLRFICPVISQASTIVNLNDVPTKALVNISKVIQTVANGHTTISDPKLKPLENKFQNYKLLINTFLGATCIPKSNSNNNHHNSSKLLKKKIKKQSSTLMAKQSKQLEIVLTNYFTNNFNEITTIIKQFNPCPSLTLFDKRLQLLLYDELSVRRYKVAWEKLQLKKEVMEELHFNIINNCEDVATLQQQQDKSNRSKSVTTILKKSKTQKKKAKRSKWKHLAKQMEHDQFNNCIKSLLFTSSNTSMITLTDEYDDADDSSSSESDSITLSESDDCSTTSSTSSNNPHSYSNIVRTKSTPSTQLALNIGTLADINNNFTSLDKLLSPRLPTKGKYVIKAKIMHQNKKVLVVMNFENNMITVDNWKKALAPKLATQPDNIIICSSNSSTELNTTKALGHYCASFVTANCQSHIFNISIKLM